MNIGNWITGAAGAITVTGSLTTAGFTSTGIDDNATSTAITIDASENVEINTGNLVIGTSGKGIDFSADGNAAGMTSEVLDDYEEGTWTPTVTFGGASVGVSYNAATGGVYTKIGNQVTVRGELALGDKGTSTSSAAIAGLPFSMPTNQRPGAAIGYSVNITFDNQMVGFGQQSVIRLYEMREAGSASQIIDTNFATSDTLIIFAMTYITS